MLVAHLRLRAVACCLVADDRSICLSLVERRLAQLALIMGLYWLKLRLVLVQIALLPALKWLYRLSRILIHVVSSLGVCVSLQALLAQPTPAFLLASLVCLAEAFLIVENRHEYYYRQVLDFPWGRRMESSTLMQRSIMMFIPAAEAIFAASSFDMPS